MVSKKLQTTIEEPLLIEIKNRMKKDKFYEESEFVKHCIRQYLLNSEDNRAPTGPRTEIMDLFTSNLENQFASV